MERNHTRRHTTEVLIIGAGPTGLVLAIELARRNVPFRLIERLAEPAPHSRAIGVQARTLEVFADLEVAEAAVASGVPIHGLHANIQGRHVGTLRLDRLDSPYPFVLSLEQSDTEPILINRLAELGGTVEREIELVGLAQDQEGVTATLRYADGTSEELRSGWVVGCDGAHSTVRRLLGLPFVGEQYPNEFLLADVRIDLPLPTNEASVFRNTAGVVALLPMRGERRYRVIIGSEAAPADAPEPTLEQIEAIVQERSQLDLQLSDPVWIARFRVSRRITPQLQLGRVFLAGDAAHIHSPMGGQGMNTGIQDSYNLGWKLALVSQGRADPTLLESYNQERHPLAEAVLRTTNTATRTALANNPLVQRGLEQVLPLVFRNDWLLNPLRLAVSELNINYRTSAIVAEHDGGLLSRMRGGRLMAGDRAPDAPLAAADGTAQQLFSVLHSGRHTLLLFGGRHPTAEDWSELRGIAMAVRHDYGDLIDSYLVAHGTTLPQHSANETLLLDPQGACHQRYAATAPCVYLVRPDGYIAFHSHAAELAPLHAYLGQLFANVEVEG